MDKSIDNKGYEKFLQQRIDELEQANSDLAKAAIMPDGYLLVPAEPTESVMQAFEDAMKDDGWDADAIGELDKYFVYKSITQAAQEQE